MSFYLMPRRLLRIDIVIAHQKLNRELRQYGQTCYSKMKRIIPNKSAIGNDILDHSTDPGNEDVFKEKALDSYVPTPLFRSDDYIVIDKPHGVRMNGDFAVTVENLIWHWYPELQKINLKIIHQLDYATSGALCIGLNRKAAANASLAFHDRKTKKQYLAVVRGHLDISKWAIRDSDYSDSADLIGENSDFENDINDEMLTNKRDVKVVNYTSNNKGNVGGMEREGDVEDKEVKVAKWKRKNEKSVDANIPSWQIEAKVTNLKLHYSALFVLLESEKAKLNLSEMHESSDERNEKNEKNVISDDIQDIKNDFVKNSSEIRNSDENCVAEEINGIVNNTDVTEDDNTTQNKETLNNDDKLSSRKYRRNKRNDRINLNQLNDVSNNSEIAPYRFVHPPLYEQLLNLSKYSFDDFEKGPKIRKLLRKALKEGGMLPEDSTNNSAHTSYPTIMAVIDENKRIEQNTKYENTDYELSTVYDPSIFTDKIFRVKSSEVKSKEKPFDTLEMSTESPFSDAKKEGINMKNDKRKDENECNEELCSSLYPTITSEHLRIKIPIAVVDGDFRMEPGNEKNKGRKSETDLQVLQYGTYQGLPVTKVLLKPLTGRRHQLRVHCLCLGYPIVGDYTYGPDKSVERTCGRMMLHAQKLMIPAPEIVERKIIGKRQKKHSGPEIFNNSISANISPIIDDLSLGATNNPGVVVDAKTDVMEIEIKRGNHLDVNDTVVCTENEDIKNNMEYLVNVSTPDPFLFENNVLIVND